MTLRDLVALSLVPASPATHQRGVAASSTPRARRSSVRAPRRMARGVPENAGGRRTPQPRRRGARRRRRCSASDRSAGSTGPIPPRSPTFPTRRPCSGPLVKWTLETIEWSPSSARGPRRRMGSAVAERLARRASRRAGVTVVSGMARGCDAAAHTGALDGWRTHHRRAGVGRRRRLPGRTPGPVHAHSRRGGAVLSEWAPGHAAASPPFPAQESDHQRAVPRDGGRRGVREERVTHHGGVCTGAGAGGDGSAWDRASAIGTADLMRCCATGRGWWLRRTTCSRNSDGRVPASPPGAPTDGHRPASGLPRGRRGLRSGHVGGAIGVAAGGSSQPIDGVGVSG